MGTPVVENRRTAIAMLVVWKGLWHNSYLTKLLVHVGAGVHKVPHEGLARQRMLVSGSQPEVISLFQIDCPIDPSRDF